MRYIFNLVLSLIVCFSICSCSMFKAKKDVKPNNQQVENKIDPKDQYRMVEPFTGDKSQIIDLIKGSATFELKCQNSTKFFALLKKNDGTILDTLANAIGEFSGTKQVLVPETTSYILDVKTDGNWSIYRR